VQESMTIEGCLPEITWIPAWVGVGGAPNETGMVFTSAPFCRICICLLAPSAAAIQGVVHQVGRGVILRAAHPTPGFSP